MWLTNKGVSCENRQDGYMNSSLEAYHSVVEIAAMLDMYQNALAQLDGDLTRGNGLHAINSCRVWFNTCNEVFDDVIK